MAANQPAAGPAAAQPGQHPPQQAEPAGGFSTLSAAKKTIGKIFGAGAGSAWSADGSSQPAQASSPAGNGLIAAFRAIIPKTSNGSTDSAAQDSSPQHQAQGSYLPPPASPGRKSQLLALHPQLPPSMQRAEWCLDDYIVMDKLYTGYASVVYKGICKRSKETVVLKSYTLSAICELYQHQIYREVRLHSSLHHENIVKLFAAFKEGDRVVMVQEYADGGDLFTLLQKYGGRLGEKVAVQMVLDPFLRVLQYLHTRSIVHRDIKPENILFTKGSMCLKLADFGLAIDLREERAVTRAGTLDYMAPEILRCPYKSKPEENKEKEHLHYGNTVDSWAVGVLTFELLVGCPPFYDQSRTNTEARIKSSVPALPATLTEGARNFVCEALSKDPTTRPTCLDLVHHPWIEMLRARRSMRVLPAPSQLAAAAEAAPHITAGAAAGPQLEAAALKGVACEAAGSLQRLEGLLADDGCAAGVGGGVHVSAASSPCLGGAAKITALNQLSRAAAGAAAAVAAGPQAVQTLPPVPMEM